MRTPAAAPAFLDDLVVSLYGHARSPIRSGRFGKMLIVDEPRHIDQIARAPDLFQKNFSFISALGLSRFNTNGAEWAARRDLTQHHYLAAARPQSRAGVYDTYAGHLAGADPASFQSLQHALFGASLTIFHRALGSDRPAGDAVAAMELARDLLRRLQYHSWSGTVYAGRRDMDRDKDEVLAAFQALVDASPTVGALLAHLTEKAAGIPHFAAIEEYVMNVFAGIETAVATIMWAIDRLGTDDVAQARIRAEVEAGEASQPYFDCFINETMRYFPAIPFLIREATADTDLDGRPVRAGELLLLSIVGAHHNRDLWQDPHIFDFSRREFMEDTYDRRAFVPFFVGPRMCGGARLAQMEVREAVRAIIRQFTVAREGHDVRFTYALALRPDTWPFLRLTRR